VLGRGKASKVVAPKPVNLPSTKKENHGLDPTLQLVPTGTGGWAAPNTTREGPTQEKRGFEGWGSNKPTNAGPPAAPRVVDKSNKPEWGDQVNIPTFIICLYDYFLAPIAFMTH
jgi:hypothetical protein